MFAWRLIFVGLLVLVAACSITQARARSINDALNVITDVADPSYGMAVTTCDARAAQIVAREGTTQEEDEASFSQLQARCNATFEAFQTIRDLQQAARAAVASATEGNSDALADAQRILIELTEAWAHLKNMLEEAGLTTEPSEENNG